MLDLPRDTGLDIPGHGRDKVNASHTYGGARLEADTIGQAVGVKIPYVIDTDFAGFIGMVNDMGGLQVNVPYAMHDTFSGAEFAAGPQTLNGEQALAYARNRHQFPNSDLTRTQNQGYLILQALTQLRAKNTGPIETLDLLADLGRHAQLDGIGLKDLYALSRLGLSVDPTTVKNVLVPVASGSGSMLQLGGDAQSLFADFRDDATLQTH
jgi:LCP family protein required for cell wall assembly